MSPISHVVGVGQLDVDEDAVVVEVVDLALLHARLEDAVEAVDVDRREELLHGLAVVVGDLGAARSVCATTVVDASAPRPPASAMVGENPLKPPKPPPSLMHDEVAGEPARDLLVDRGLGGLGEHEEQGHEG